MEGRAFWKTGEMVEVLVRGEWRRWRPSGTVAAWGEGTGLARDRGPWPPSATALALTPAGPAV